MTKMEYPGNYRVQLDFERAAERNENAHSTVANGHAHPPVLVGLRTIDPPLPLGRSMKSPRAHQMPRVAVTILLILTPTILHAEPPATEKAGRPAIAANAEWLQWGGSPARNNVSTARNIPIQWNVGEFDAQTGRWLSKGAKNISWVAQLGDQTYGTSVIADGRVYVGTNNHAGYLKRYPPSIDLGCLLCFDKVRGSLLWQYSSEKLPTGAEHDWPQQGICCAPLVEHDRLWLVNNRGEIVCLDTNGFHDGKDDGPVQHPWGRLFKLRPLTNEPNTQITETIRQLNEGDLSQTLKAQFTDILGTDLQHIQIEVIQPGKQWTLQARMGKSQIAVRLAYDGNTLDVQKRILPADLHEADVIWQLDMMKQLHISQHNMCSCSVTAVGDILFVCTSNGVDETHKHIPAPNAPSFIAVNKNSGAVCWTDRSPGTNILHGQWSSPAAGRLGGVPQVIFGAGDGWVYSFRADQGNHGVPTLLWKFDGNPKQSKWIPGGAGTRNSIIATPVICNGLVYIAMGQDPEHGEGPGHLWCIDPTRRGDVSSQLAVQADDHSKLIPRRRVQAVIPEQGEASIANPNSALVWEYSQLDADGDGKIAFEEELHRAIGMPVISAGLLIIADFNGLVHCLDAKSGKRHWTYDLMSAVWGSPLVVDNRVYVANEDGDVAIFELSTKAHEPISLINMGDSIYTTPVAAGTTLYIASRTYLFAINALSTPP